MDDQEIYDAFDSPLEDDEPQLVPEDFLQPGAELPSDIAPDLTVQHLSPNAKVSVVTKSHHGLPVRVIQPMQFRTETEEMLMQLMSMPIGGLEEESFLANANNIQKVAYNLMVKAREGDSLDAVKYALDRVLGKPKQQTESFNVSASYEDYLKQLSEEPDGP